jgi:L-lactate dehydrogenase
MRITQAILRNQNTVLSVSSAIDNYYGISNVCFSLPTVVNRSGIEKVLRVELGEKEVTSLRHSAQVLQQTISKLGM